MALGRLFMEGSGSMVGFLLGTLFEWKARSLMVDEGLGGQRLLSQNLVRHTSFLVKVGIPC